MPVPSTMSDLSTLAGSNSPAGTEAIGNSLDNYLRAQASILRSTYACASSSIAAASTTDIATADGESVLITGTATITSLGTGFVGCKREVRFQGVCTLTNSANIVLPYGASITTVAGDALTFRCTASGVWLMTAKSSSLSYTPVNKAGDTMTGALALSLGTYSAANPISVTGSLTGSGRLVSLTNTDTSVASLMAVSLQSGAGAAATAGVYAPTYTGVAAFSGRYAIDAGDSGLAYSAVGASGDHRWHTGASRTLRMSLSSAGVLDVVGAITAASVTPGAGRTLSKITVSSAAPGALASGELYLRY